MRIATCQKCGDLFEPEEIQEGVFQDRLCPACFEDELEAYEERKRQRIAEENEY